MTDTNIFRTMDMSQLYVISLTNKQALKIYKQRVAQIRKGCSNAAYDADNGHGIMANFSSHIHKVGDRYDSLRYHYY